MHRLYIYIIYLCIIHTYCTCYFHQPSYNHQPGKLCLYSIFSRNPLRFFLANSNQSADPHIRAAWISFKLLVSIHQPVLLSMNARRGFMVFSLRGFTVFTEKLRQRNLLIQFFSRFFFFQIVTSQWPSQTWGTRNSEILKKTQGFSAFFKIRDVVSRGNGFTKLNLTGGSVERYLQSGAEIMIFCKGSCGKCREITPTPEPRTSLFPSHACHAF